jgi:hypothetical protein
LKINFLKSQLDYFAENLGSLSEEQGEKFYQDLKEIEGRCQRKLNINMLTYYFWMPKREVPESTRRKREQE